MQAPRGQVTRLMFDILKRAVAGNLADRFQLRDVAPGQVVKYITALDNLVDAGFVERIREGCGRWFYRVGETGLAAVRAGKMPRIKKVFGEMEA